MTPDEYHTLVNRASGLLITIEDMCKQDGWALDYASDANWLTYCPVEGLKCCGIRIREIGRESKLSAIEYIPSLLGNRQRKINATIQNAIDSTQAIERIEQQLEMGGTP